MAAARRRLTGGVRSACGTGTRCSARWTHASGGVVFTTGCTDWACGLGVGDDDVEQVTRNLLDRLGRRSASSEARWVTSL